MKNKILVIDFKKDYLYSNIDIEWENFTFVKKYNRVVIDNVVEVIYKNNYVCVFYKDTTRANKRKEQVFEINGIETMVIN